MFRLQSGGVGVGVVGLKSIDHAFCSFHEVETFCTVREERMIATHGHGARGGVERTTAVSRKHGHGEILAGLLLLASVITHRPCVITVSTGGSEDCGPSNSFSVRGQDVLGAASIQGESTHGRPLPQAAPGRQVGFVELFVLL